MRKVLFIISALYGGGAERALSNIITHFPDDWDIDILVNNETLVEFPYKGNILSLSLPGFGNRKTVFYFIRETVKRINYLRKIKKSNHYDACISFLDSANISNVLSGNKYCKTIVSIRINMFATKSKLLYRLSVIPLVKLIYRHADKIVAVSKEIELGLICRLGMPESGVQTIVNGYDCSYINEQMRTAPIQIDKRIIGKWSKIVVSVGRLDEQKGHWHLIRAFSKVIEQEKDALLLIVGSGSLERYLIELVHAYNLEKNVIFVGYSSNPFWYISKASVFILPSLNEGYPNALAEAICCGVPCVATDFHSGAREILAPHLDVMGERTADILEEQYGILVPLCSGKMYRNKEVLELEERKMAEAIIMLLSDSEKQQYYREKSAERSKSLGIDTIVEEWVDLILESKVVGR